ncbi:MAG TPA: type II toxin-antitoxin system RelE/ParE family toxin [Devosia sp.]
MAWTIEYTDTAKKQLAKLDKQVARRILDYMDTRIAPADDPRAEGKPLKGVLGLLWRYRVGDYRLFCEIEDRRVRILVVRVGNRRDIYR